MSTEFRPRIRILKQDIDGRELLPYALTKIRGIGIPFAHALLRALRLPLNMRAGELSDAQIQLIEEALKKPPIPKWMYNRQRDPETGKDMHLYTSDLEFAIKMDIKKMIEMRCWKGVRHMYGLKVRGQRTRTTGRKGRTVGVERKKK